MTDENWLVLGILAVSLFLFIREKPRMDVVAMGVLIVTVLTGLVDPRTAFAGFADPAVVTVWAVFIISGGITKTGVAEQIGQWMIRQVGDNPTKLLILMMTTAGVMSAFMNNIGAVAILLPAVMSICRKQNIPPSKMLIPLAIASLLGGNITLIGTPPNLIAAQMMADAGVEPFGFFDFAPTGIVVLVVGVVYMLVFGRNLLPTRSTGSEVAESYDVRSYLTEVVVTDKSPLVWKKINAIRFGLENDVAIVYVRRGDEVLQQASDRRVQANDVFLLEGPRKDVERISERLKLRLRKALQQDELDKELEGQGQIVEIALSPKSIHLGKTLREIGFRSRYRITVLAIRHEGEQIASHFVDVPLKLGDVLLAQASTNRINALKPNPHFIILEPTPTRRDRQPKRAPYAVGILLLTIAGILLMPRDYVATMMLAGGIGMVLVGALTMEDAYQSIDWKSVFLIAGMLPLGSAMQTTGTAQLVADSMISLTGGESAVVLLITLFIITTLLTSVISNAAAAVLLIPIAISGAISLGASPQPFVMTTVIAASSSFLLPIGHQANIIIYGPGNYRFFDFVKVGIWLNLLLLVVVALIVPIFWPF